MKKLLKFLGLSKKSKTSEAIQASLTLVANPQPLNARQHSKVSISYAITVHNEGANYLDPLFQKLLQHLSSNDEIVVLDDFSDEPSTIATLQKYKNKIRFQQNALNGHFANHKNQLKPLCTKKYIFQIDADEIMDDPFFLNLKNTLLSNPHVDLFHVPRINTVDGLTDDYIQKNGWRINEKGWINSPDYQGRIFKNKPGIQWSGKVHETIVGHKVFAYLPYNTETFSIIHHKQIDRQRQQNEFYDTLM